MHISAVFFTISGRICLPIFEIKMVQGPFAEYLGECVPIKILKIVET